MPPFEVNAMPKRAHPLVVTTFRKNDPFHFGTVGVAVVTLFRVATLENWSVVMYINYYGFDHAVLISTGLAPPRMTFANARCNSQYDSVNNYYNGVGTASPYGPPPGGLGRPNVVEQTLAGAWPRNACWKPVSQPVRETTKERVHGALAKRAKRLMFSAEHT